MSSVTLVHPAKAVGQNEVPFVTDTRVVPSNIVLDRDLGPPARRGNLEGRNPQFTLMPPIAVDQDHMHLSKNFTKIHL